MEVTSALLGIASLQIHGAAKNGSPAVTLPF
jgi:hypothetical protein